MSGKEWLPILNAVFAFKMEQRRTKPMVTLLIIFLWALWSIMKKWPRFWWKGSKSNRKMEPGLKLHRVLPLWAGVLHKGVQSFSQKSSIAHWGRFCLWKSSLISDWLGLLQGRGWSRFCWRWRKSLSRPYVAMCAVRWEKTLQLLFQRLLRAPNLQRFYEENTGFLLTHTFIRTQEEAGEQKGEDLTLESFSCVWSVSRFSLLWRPLLCIKHSVIG